jgi:hypothetical protein
MCLCSINTAADLLRAPAAPAGQASRVPLEPDRNGAGRAAGADAGPAAGLSAGRERLRLPLGLGLHAARTQGDGARLVEFASCR